MDEPVQQKANDLIPRFLVATSAFCEHFKLSPRLRQAVFEPRQVSAASLLARGQA